MHSVNDLVVSCIDYRFRGKISHWIDERFNGEADIVALAGVSKAILEGSSQKIALNQIRIAKDLHSVKNIYLIDHIDCGAYGGSIAFKNKDDEIDMHEDQLREAATIIEDHFPDLIVHAYIGDFNYIIDIDL
jgi:carbonic anhydrase